MKILRTESVKKDTGRLDELWGYGRVMTLTVAEIEFVHGGIGAEKKLCLTLCKDKLGCAERCDRINSEYMNYQRLFGYIVGGISGLVLGATTKLIYHGVSYGIHALCWCVKGGINLVRRPHND